jgi:hypothetical protein
MFLLKPKANSRHTDMAGALTSGGYEKIKTGILSVLKFFENEVGLFL